MFLENAIISKVFSIWKYVNRSFLHLDQLIFPFLFLRCLIWHNVRKSYQTGNSLDLYVKLYLSSLSISVCMDFSQYVIVSSCINWSILKFQFHWWLLWFKITFIKIKFQKSESDLIKSLNFGEYVIRKFELIIAIK